MQKHSLQESQFTKVTDKNPISLRYRDKGNVHMDFHGATNTTINFIIEKYGIETMNDIFKKVGNDVYADMKKHIQSGNIKVLAEHWQHFFDREGADFSISIKEDEIILTVKRCTAYEHVKKLVGKVSSNFCNQTIKTNEAIAEGTPYEIKTEILGEASCKQIIRKRL